MSLVIFDLDGTVLDTLGDLTAAVNMSLSAMDFPKRTREEVKNFVGNGVPKLIERALPEGLKSPENIEKTLRLFNENYSLHYADTTRPFDGMTELLSRLKSRKIKLAMFSNKPDVFTLDLAEKFCPGAFDLVLGSREGFPKKPDPAGERYIMDKLNSSPACTLHVGDSDTDVYTAHNAGVRALGVSWGYRSRESILKAGACDIADNVKELEDKILRLCLTSGE